MDENKDMTVREATVHVINESENEFSSLKEAFRESAEKFDSGDDLAGLQIIQEKIVKRLSNLSEFCFTICNVFGEVVGEELKKKISAQNESLDKLMKVMTEETGKGNFTEVGDLLRFDCFDLINGFSSVFPKIAERFKNSDEKILDEK